jgi:CheY-specific phosphatase CheX
MKVAPEALRSVARKVLETTAFAIVMPEEESGPAAGPMLRATVRFDGPAAGCFALAIPESVMPALANNMLGRDETEPCSSQEIADALGELANIMCGNALFHVAGPAAVFDLAPPEVASAAEGVRTTPGGTSVIMPLANGFAEVSCVLEDGL